MPKTERELSKYMQRKIRKHCEDVQEYRTTIKSLGMNQREAADFLGIDERTSRRYALGETEIPGPVRRCFELLQLLKVLGVDINRKLKETFQ